ncbi:MAG: PD-(D/E)XK nuclease family protein [Pyrobaculum sp.]
MEVLTARPHIVYEALAKLLPWEKLMKEIEEIKNTMATKKELEEVKNIMAKKEELEKIGKRLEEIENRMATKEDLQKLEERLGEVEGRMATKEDLKTLATKEELEDIKNRMATKEDLKAFATKEDLRAFATKEDLKAFATKEDLKAFATKEELRAEIRKLSIQITALGARWGVWSEEAFREGVRELLREAGYVVERWTYFDDKGQVYGYPSEVELDVVVKNGVTILVEIASAVRRGDLPYVKRKAELYEKVSGRRVERVLLVSPFIHDKNPDFVRALARSLGIDIVSPAEHIEPGASG